MGQAVGGALQAVFSLQRVTVESSLAGCEEIKSPQGQQQTKINKKPPAGFVQLLEHPFISLLFFHFLSSQKYLGWKGPLEVT